MNINPLNLITPEGFDAEYFKLLTHTDMSPKQCFNHLNQIYQDATGTPRYTDFASYRVAKSKRYRKNKT
jgi:hypothetical protein